VHGARGLIPPVGAERLSTAGTRVAGAVRMLARFLVWTVLLACGVAACSASAPEAPGFQSGTIAGVACPPGTEAEGSCSDPDCGVPCVATTACASGDACPNGTECAAVDGDKWCMPKVCKTAAGCDDGEICQKQGFSQGVCLKATR
jgi:hypothetical protein